MGQPLPPIEITPRLQRARAEFQLKADGAVFIAALQNIRYFTGFTGSAGILLLLRDSALLLVDNRYSGSAAQEVTSSEVQVVTVDRSRQFEAISEALAGVRTLGFDPSQLTVAVHTQLQEALPGVTLVPMGGRPEKLRRVKDDAEIARMKDAARVASQAFSEAIPMLEAAPTEKEFALLLESKVRQAGADEIGFNFIVASGPNSANPHIRPTDRVIRAGEPVLIDFGAVIDGYHSDIARTVWYGKLGAQYVPIYEAALAAHREGLRALKVGASNAEVDARCRTAFNEHEFLQKPLHPSGHSLGLEIHERPFLGPYADEVLEDGYVVTIEPGLYVKDVAGCRIEDMVLIRPDGPEVISVLPYQQI